jgi:hypothetical protein
MEEGDRKFVRVKHIPPEDFVEVRCGEDFWTISTTVEEVLQYTAKETSPI